MAKLPGYTPPSETLPAQREEARVRPTLHLPAPGQPLDVIALGQLMAASGFFQDAREAGQACVKILAGQELGIGPVASMTGIYVIKGRITLSAGLMAALVKRSKRYDYHVAVHTNERCAISFYENGEPIGESVFTLEDAKAAGVGHGDNWKKYPRNMLFSRALTNGVRWYCPDLTSSTVYAPDEMGAIETVVDDTGDVIDAQATVHSL